MATFITLQNFEKNGIQALWTREDCGHQFLAKPDEDCTFIETEEDCEECIQTAHDSLSPEEKAVKRSTLGQEGQVIGKKKGTGPAEARLPSAITDTRSRESQV